MLRLSTEKLVEKCGAPASSKHALTAIRIAERRLRSKTLPLPDKRALLSLKASLLQTLAEYLRIDTLRAAENTLLQSVKLDSKDVVTLTALANLHLYQTANYGTALRWAQRAAATADRQRKFVRLAYGTLCRAALADNKPELIKKSLARLVEYEPSAGTDIALESDFIARIPPRTVAPSLLHAYRKKIKAARARRG
jgi:hypothetical protein